MKDATRHGKKEVTEEFSLALLPVKNTWKCPGWKRIDIANLPTADTQLSSRNKDTWRIKGKGKDLPKIHPEITKYILLMSTEQQPLKQ